MEMIPFEKDISQIYVEECHADPEYEEIIFDEGFHNVIACRYVLCFEMYFEKLSEDEAQYQHSMSDFLDYVLRMCNSDDLFGNITIFDRFFATLVFIMVLCLKCHYLSLVDFMYYGHICWAIYFDKHTEEFHKQGGWIQLKEVAKPYEALIESIRMYRDVFVEKDVLYSTIYNYTKFKQNAKFNDCGTISMSWVKFKNEQTYTHYRSDTTDDDKNFHRPETFREIEISLQSLLKFCNPSVSRVLYSTQQQLQNLDESSRSAEIDKVTPCLNEFGIITSATKILKASTSPMKQSALESETFAISPAATSMEHFSSQNDLTKRDVGVSCLSYNKSFEKNISLRKGKASSRDCDERNTKIKKSKNIKDDTCNEKRDIINFLRMILVLGDNQGIHYVLSTLHGIHEKLNSKKCSTKTFRKKVKD
ncbi:hypothetical protein HNY73_010520 [Argiope bruennichi]|uniref:Uncharacterized protein n=1 Tax=Argiope bruennichi TaxID=94029 RepID=A0A8T0F3S3_ARGBR|nr:hypothetical protein HNY73_010520 [Argiope bruennichi]